MEMSFGPEELQGFSGLDKDQRLAAIHLDVWLYLLSRYQGLQKYKQICWLRAEETSQTCNAEPSS